MPGCPVHEAGRVTYYGLWPDGHPRTKDNGDGTDIRINMEVGATAAVSRFYRLTPGQELRLRTELKRTIGWRYTNTCASWTVETVQEVVSVDIDADDCGGFETPRELGAALRKLEAKEPTSAMAPELPKAQVNRSWSF